MTLKAQAVRLAIEPMEEQFISNNQEHNASPFFSNHFWLARYNKLQWLLCDIFRTAFVIYAIVATGAHGHTALCYTILAIVQYSMVSLLALYLVHAVLNRRPLGRCLSSIPGLVVAFLLMHLRFRDYLSHCDRDTMYVGFLEVLGFPGITVHTKPLVMYVLEPSNSQKIKQRVIAANYFIYTKFKRNFDGEGPMTLTEYIADVHDMNVADNVRQHYDISWLDIRRNFDKQTLQKNQVHISQAVWFGLYTFAVSFVLMCYVCVRMIMVGEIACFVFVLYLLLAVFVLAVDLKHCEFAFYLYHLLTSLQPLQSTQNIDWENLDMKNVEALRVVMYEYQKVFDALVKECDVHPDIASVIRSFLVHRLPRKPRELTVLLAKDL